MNELVQKTDGRADQGAGPVAPVASGVVKKPAGVSPPGTVPPPPLPPVAIGKPGYKFRYEVNTPQGQEERREHERIRKAEKRAATRVPEPLPSPAADLVDPLQAPAGIQEPGNLAPAGAVVAEPFVPWVAADVADFTDELIELSEAKRVADFVKLAREAQMPAKFIAEVEKKSGYPVQSKNALKRTLAECAAKWLNKTGVSSKNKEEVKLLFCMVTVKMQGIRLKRDLLAMIEADKEKREAESQPKPETPGPKIGPAPLALDREEFMKP